MTVIPSSPHDLQSIGIPILIVVTLCVIYRRVALQIILIAITTFTIYGAVLLIQALEHVAK